MSDLPARNTSKPKTRFTILLFFIFFLFTNLNYNLKVFIPLLESLTIFHLMKDLDYKDWITTTLLRLENKHLTEEGKLIIGLICNRINVNRLLTNVNTLNNNNLNIDYRIVNLLQKPKSGIWVYDQDRLIKESPFPQ